MNLVNKIVNPFFAQNSDFEPQMAEQFANERKNIKSGWWIEILEPQIAEQFANERKC